METLNKYFNDTLSRTMNMITKLQLRKFWLVLHKFSMIKPHSVIINYLSYSLDKSWSTIERMWQLFLVHKRRINEGRKMVNVLLIENEILHCFSFVLLNELTIPIKKYATSKLGWFYLNKTNFITYSYDTSIGQFFTFVLLTKTHCPLPFAKSTR